MNEPKIISEGMVKDGTLKIFRRKEFIELIKTFEGKNVVVIVERKKVKRSYLQNNLYRLYLNIIAKEIGYTDNELHEIFKKEFLKKVAVIGDKEYEFGRTTTNLSTVAFGEYINKIIIWAAEQGINLPQPEQQQKLKI